jgi:GNAT superfamily N-acetyltransferase
MDMTMRFLDRKFGEYRFYVEPIADNLAETMAMWQDHWNEQKEEDLRGVTFKPAVGYFEYLESHGDFVHITVRERELLVGHFGLHFGINKNTSKRVAGDDFYYIKPEHRKGLLGVKLIKFARDYAFNLGAEEFSLTYRVSVDDLDPVMRRCGLHKIANVYTMRR